MNKRIVGFIIATFWKYGTFEFCLKDACHFDILNMEIFDDGS